MPANSNYKRFAALLRSFQTKKVLVIGDIMLDEYCEGKVKRVSPEGAALVLEDVVERFATGGAGNVAKNLIQLGAKAVIMSVVGVDEQAKKLIEAAHHEGYDATFLRQDPEYDTTAKTRFVSGPSLLLRVDRNNKKVMQKQTVETLIRDLPAAMEGVDGVLVSDYNKNTLTHELVGSIKQLAHRRRLPVLADVKPQNAEWFKGVDMLSPNAEEARAFVGVQGDTYPLEDVAYDLCRKFSALVFLTAGDQGIYVGHRRKMTELVPQRHKIEMKDASGCGDTVSAVILLAVLCGADPIEAAELANAAGAVVASRRGAVAPTPHEVLAMLRS